MIMEELNIKHNAKLKPNSIDLGAGQPKERSVTARHWPRARRRKPTRVGKRTRVDTVHAESPPQIAVAL